MRDFSLHISLIINHRHFTGPCISSLICLDCSFSCFSIFSLLISLHKNGCTIPYSLLLSSAGYRSLLHFLPLLFIDLQVTPEEFSSCLFGIHFNSMFVKMLSDFIVQCGRKHLQICTCFGQDLWSPPPPMLIFQTPNIILSNKSKL